MLDIIEMMSFITLRFNETLNIPIPDIREGNRGSHRDIDRKKIPKLMTLVLMRYSYMKKVIIE